MNILSVMTSPSGCSHLIYNKARALYIWQTSHKEMGVLSLRALPPWYMARRPVLLQFAVPFLNLELAAWVYICYSHVYKSITLKSHFF
jgi:hypothetical protein